MSGPLIEQNRQVEASASERPAARPETDLDKNGAESGLRISGGPATGVPAPPDNLKKYSGPKVTVDFFETGVKNALKMLTTLSGRNFAVDHDVSGRITLSVGKPVSWEAVLDLMLGMNGLERIAQGGIIRIARRDTLIAEEKAALKRLREMKRLQSAGEHETAFISLNYADAGKATAHIAKIITADPKLDADQRGKISVDARTNSVIITDTPEVIARAKHIIGKLDRVTPQVMIEARIVEASASFSKNLGVEWGLGPGISPSTNYINTNDWMGSANTGVGDRLNAAVGTGPQKRMNDAGGTYGANLSMNFPLNTSGYGSVGLNFTRLIGSHFILNATLKAMESEGKGRIISSPRILTLDNKKALIKQGLEYPYLERDSSGLATVTFKDINLVLEVTPHVTPDARVSLKINILKSDIGEMIGGQQSFTTKQAKTELLINDGDTVIIGGIIKTTKSSTQTGFPLLSRLPLVGWLFGTTGSTDRKEELLIFITPRIVKLGRK